MKTRAALSAGLLLLALLFLLPFLGSEREAETDALAPADGAEREAAVVPTPESVPRLDGAEPAPARASHAEALPPAAPPSTESAAAELPAVGAWYGRIVTPHAIERLEAEGVAAWRSADGRVPTARATASRDGILRFDPAPALPFCLLVEVHDWRWAPRLVHVGLRSPARDAAFRIAVGEWARLFVRVRIGGVEAGPTFPLHLARDPATTLEQAALERALEPHGRIGTSSRGRVELLRSSDADEPEWTFDHLVPGERYELRVDWWNVRTEEGVVETGASVILASGEEREFLLELDPLPLVGRWTDRHGGPIAHHSVQLDRDPPVATDAEGRFEIAWAPEGDHDLHLGGPTAGAPSEVAPRSVRILVPALDRRRPLELTSDRGLFVHGRLLGPNGVPPLAGRVTATPVDGGPSTSATCADDGTFRVGPLLAGEYEVRGIETDPGSARDGLSPMSAPARARAGGEAVSLRCE